MAIAFDAATNGGNTSGTSLTYAHIVTGSNPILTVGVVGGIGTDVVTGVTYNGVAMALVRKIVGGTGGSVRDIYLFNLTGAILGTHNVVVSASGVTFIASSAASYSGAAQSGQPNASAQGVIGSNVSAAISVTSTVDNCWIVGFLKQDNVEAPVAGAGTTVRASGSLGGYGSADSNGPIHPAGVATLNAGPQSAATAWSNLAMTIAPVTSSNFFLLFP